MSSNDILVEIPNHHLPKLAALFENKAPWAPHMVTFVHIAMKWKENTKYKDKIVFLSPYNCWETDGTIIVIVQLLSTQDLYVFTLDDQCTNLYKGLLETNLITYANKRSLFYAVHEKHVPTVKKYLDKKQISVEEKPCFMYAIAPEEATKFTLECSDVYVKTLEPSAAKRINDLWPHKFLQSEQYLASLIDVNGGYGAFLKSTGQMVAWVLKHTFGHVAILQTEEEHTRKGYATLVTKALCREMAEDGFWPAFVVSEVAVF
ncbi:hypothetical protein Zmor_019824 [Zophobas morio]|uniref:Glycine N-acyltransferase-like protein n=1 Tax=Zophobas morio TaxID=2755281 RepID=A0AA38I0J4_9CUCU|nr:hypothetical protein Zmor_019824 [Zophobas morio]